MTTADLRANLDDVIRQATAMRATLDNGGLPMLADARILRGQAQCVEGLTEVAYIRELRAIPERTAAEDRAAQCVLVAE